jgi:hypothetical protein
MPINRKNIIIVSLAFLILFALINWQTLRILISWKPNEKMSVWDFLTARPVPSSDGQYPIPKPINDEEFRKMLPVPVSIETWLERLNSKKIPETQVAEWKIYKNQEYGFELQYPSTWEIREGEVEGYAIRIYFEKGASGENASFVPEKSVSLGIIKISLSEYLKLIPERNERLITKGLTPDAIINGIKIIIDPARTDVGSAAFLPMLFEHNGILYSFGMNGEMREDEIIEYMIKSFRFLKQ